MKTLKNFKFKIELLAMASILSFFVTSCCTDKPCPPSTVDGKIKAINLTPEDYNFLQSSSGPLYKAEVLDLEMNAGLFYTYKDTDEKRLGFVTAKMSVANLIQYYNSSNGIVAIRFYPSVVADTSVQLIMTKSTSFSLKDTNPDQSAVLLDRDFVEENFDTISFDLARVQIENYFNSVYIDTVKQTNENFNYKESRVFRWDEIEAYLRANISGFDIDSPETFANYSMVFKIGFTDNGQARRFYSRLNDPDPALIADMLQGFTVIMYLNHSTAGDILDNEDHEGENTVYYKKALEIAHVCPPVCGDLY